MLLKAWKQLAEVSYFLNFYFWYVFDCFWMIFNGEVFFGSSNLFFWVGQNIENGHMSLEEYVAMLPQYVTTHRKVSHVKKRRNFGTKKWLIVK